MLHRRWNTAGAAPSWSIRSRQVCLYGRQGKALSNFSHTLPSHQSNLAQQVLKDPYHFDFLTLGADAHERHLERGLLTHLQKFLLEMGAGFSFVGSQYYLTRRGIPYGTRNFNPHAEQSIEDLPSGGDRPGRHGNAKLAGCLGRGGDEAFQFQRLCPSERRRILLRPQRSVPPSAHTAVAIRGKKSSYRTSFCVPKRC